MARRCPKCTSYICYINSLMIGDRLPSQIGRLDPPRTSLHLPCLARSHPKGLNRPPPPSRSRGRTPPSNLASAAGGRRCSSRPPPPLQRRQHAIPTGLRKRSGDLRLPLGKPRPDLGRRSGVDSVLWPPHAGQANVPSAYAGARRRRRRQSQENIARRHFD